ncbi:hypothetical protein DRJ19_02690 [Candidatus Woesearchaeota archaeon]|nr:MAG: hypothetical protein DRJ19_02690 [Candidatus Woesearchaeota archaeon]
MSAKKAYSIIVRHPEYTWREVILEDERYRISGVVVPEEDMYSVDEGRKHYLLEHRVEYLKKEFGDNFSIKEIDVAKAEKIISKLKELERIREKEWSLKQEILKLF